LNFSEGRLGRAFLRFAAPFTKLRAVPLIGPGLRWASAKLIPRDALTWVQVQRGPAQGIWLHLNPRTGRDYFNGDVEPEVQAVLHNYLRPGMTVFDIGANIGFFSLLAARLVGASGRRVTAFEADPEIAARLRENVARNQGGQVSVEDKAVWSSSSSVFFARADADVSPDRGLGHVIEIDAEKSAPGTIRVEAVSVDEYVLMSGAPDFIKCVEGAEVEVFRGAEKLLNEKQPLILCEMHGEENRQTLLKLFANLGYRCEPCGKNHIFAQHTK